jgi:hypothetical protein
MCVVGTLSISVCAKKRYLKFKLNQSCDAVGKQITITEGPTADSIVQLLAKVSCKGQADPSYVGNSSRSRQHV